MSICSDIQGDLYPFHKGWLDPSTATTIRTHLAGCPTCSAELAAFSVSSAALKRIEEIEPDPAILEFLRRRSRFFSTRARPFRAVRATVGIAAAASLIVAVLSFFVVHTVGAGALPTIAYLPPAAPANLHVGQAVPLRSVVAVPTYMVLALPDVGTLKVDSGSRIEFQTLRRVRLHQGELFADIHPGGQGFVVETVHAKVAVRGTSFGVRADEAMSKVYVIEGTVECSSATGRVELQAGQVAQADSLVRHVEGADASSLAGWIGTHERPSLGMSVERQADGWILKLQTDTAVPQALRGLRDADAWFYAHLVPENGTAYNVRLEPAHIEFLEGRTGGAGRWLVDRLHPCVLRVHWRSEDAPGGEAPRKILFGYLSRPDADQKELWSGTAESKLMDFQED